MTPTDDDSRREPASNVHAPHPVDAPSGRRNEALALALDATLTSIWDYQVLADRVTLDRNWSKMRGGPPVETDVNIRTMLDLVHPDDRASAFRASRECIVGRADEYSQEYRIRDFQDRWLWVQTRGRVTERDAQGRATRIIGTNLDISQRKHTELAATREAEFLRALNETALALMQRRSMVEILEALAARSARLLDSAVVEVALIEGELLVTRASAGLSPSPLNARSSRQEARLSWRAVDTREPVLIKSYRADPEANPVFDGTGYGPVAIFPILHGNICLGVIAFSRTDGARTFGDDERAKGLLVAQLSALTIHNAAIYQHAVQIAEARTMALRESEQLYRTLVESVTHAHYIADRRSIFTYCNPAMYAMGGFAPGELINQSSFRLVAEEDRVRVMTTYKRWIADPQVEHADCEFRVVAKHGRKFWVQQTTNFVRDQAGRVIEGRNVLQDISERKAAEATLRESEERFRGVFDHSPIPIALLSIPEGRIVEINQAGATAFGLSRDQMVGHTSTELGLWVDEAERAQYLQRLTTDKLVRSFEARTRRHDGQVLTMLYNGSLVSINGQPCSLNSLQDISERKAAEAARDRSLALNQSTLESTADGILVVDQEGRIETFNHRFIQMWRIPREVIASRDDARTLATVLDQLVDPDAFVAKVQMLYRHPGLESSDTVAFRDGRVFERYSRPLLLAGRPAGRVWSFRDVTAARTAEAALRESEAQFRAVYDESPIPVILLATTGHIREVNKAAIETFGFSRDEALGRTTVELGVWPDPSHRELLLNRLQTEGAVRGFETILLHKHGRKIHVIYNASRITIGGQPYLLNSVIDISDRKRAEQLFHDLFAFSPDAYVIAAADGRIVDVNERMLALFGYDRCEVVGVDWSHLVPAEARPKLAERLANYFANPVPRPMGASPPGIVARAKDGRVFPVDISLSPLESGGEVRIVAAIRDTTAQLAAEAALRNSEAQLRQAQKMESLGTLAGGIAHDFNNILTGILGYTQLAIADLDPAHPARAWLEGTLKSGERAKNLVNQILTFSRKTESTRSRVRLQQVVIEAVELLRSTLPAMVQLESHIETTCPPVLANANEFHQVILNLCTNSWHALPTQGGRISLSLAACEVTAEEAGRRPPLRAGSHLRLAVEDNGAGMDASTIERIFEPFFTTKEAGKGTGLGLAVVHSVVTAHDGAVFVESHPGVGTRFEILVPTLAGEESPIAPVNASELPRGHGEAILVVDDEPGSGNVITQLAGRLGYQPTYCSDPREAPALLRANHYAALVTDLAMPGMTGDALAAEALALRPGLPVLLLSGFIEPAMVEKLRRLGVRETLQKPPGFPELAAALRRCLPAGPASPRGK